MTSIQKYREPEQLELDLFFVDQDTDGHKYSQSIELYDAVPKYVWGRQPRDPSGHLGILYRVFRHGAHEYEAEINPARIRKKVKGVEIELSFYPGVREELVEDALRKLATEGRAQRIDKQYGVRFSLSELKRELERTGHSYNTSQLKEALEICSKASLKLTRKSDGAIASQTQTIFPQYTEAKRANWIESKTQFAVEFHGLVTKSIEQKSFRQINYERSMQLSNALARWLHKRMSHNYRQAQAFSNTYTLGLATIVRDSGMTARARVSDNRKAVRKALEELKKPPQHQGEESQQVIFQWEEEEIKEGRSLLDVKFHLQPSLVFTQEMKRANAKTKMIR
jgi:hypothetical protein